MSDLTDALIDESVKTVYIAGPITGNGQYRRDFKNAAEALRRLGLTVVNPVELDDEDGLDADGAAQDAGLWGKCLARDLNRIVDADVDAIVVLPGWESSTGARLERDFAFGSGLRVFDSLGDELEDGADLDEDEAPAESVLEEAQRLVGGSRGSDYGHPFYDFGKTARLASVILEQKLRPNVVLQPEDIPLLMIAVKMSRQINKPKRDNLTDIAGYVLTAEMVEQKRDELEAEAGAALAEDLPGSWEGSD